MLSSLEEEYVLLEKMYDLARVVAVGLPFGMLVACASREMPFWFIMNAPRAE